jgi:hypothetical protein
MHATSLDAPMALPAIDVTSNSFVANWAAVEDATEYTVELYSLSAASDGAGDKEVLLSEDFMNCKAGNMLLDYTTINGYMSSNDWDCENVYSETGALRIGTSKNPGYLYAPWIEASGNVLTTIDASLHNTKDTGVVLSIEYRDKNTELVAYEDFDITGTGEKITLSADVDGYFYITLHTEMSTGNKRVKIDNLNVSQGTSFKKELVSTVTTTATSYAFGNLEEGAIYLYRVKAANGNISSPFSDYVEVALLPTGIDEIVADGDWCEVYAISGVKLYSGDKAGMPVLQRGVYVVVTARGAHKVVIE